MNLTQAYANLINELKNEIRQARIKANLSVNKELILLYWKIGKRILDQQEKEGWGSKVIESISNDLQREFPEITGFSSVNLKRMRSFALEYPDLEIGSQLVTQLPWGHLQELLFKVKDKKLRDWYAQKNLEHDWSRNVLTDTNLK